MREETVVYKIFKFDELSKEVQEKVLDKNRHWNVEFFDWWCNVYDDYKERLEAVGFEDPKIWFSGFSSQGDGACFDATVDSEKLVKFFIEAGHDKYKKLLRIAYNNIQITINSHGSNYSHERCRYINLELNNYRECPRLEKLVNEFEEDVEQLRLDFSREIYRSLETDYEWLTSDECVKESLEANEVEFKEDGSIY